MVWLLLLINVIYLIYEEISESIRILLAMWKPNEKVDIYKPEKQPRQKPILSNPNLELSAYRKGRQNINFCYSSHIV